MECQEYYPLRLLAEQIVGRLGSKDYLSEILACYYWTLGHTRYANDPTNVELVRSPAEVFARLQENVTRLMAVAKGETAWRPSLDCDDMVAVETGLFLSLGRNVQIVTVAFEDKFVNGTRQYSHVLIRVKEPRTGTWIVLDPVAAEGAAGMLARVKAFKIWPVA